MQGLFWMFLISNAVTVNTTVYITALINFYDDNDAEKVLLGFNYGIIFIAFAVIYSLLARKGI